MTNLISLQNSGESFEKSIALFSTSCDSPFYKDYNVFIFYGKNLPKKDKKIPANGTVGFYSKYFSDYEWIPYCSQNELWGMKVEILDSLIKKRVITARVATKLEESFERFWLVISRLPFEYIYPDFMNKVKSNTEKMFNNVHFKQLYLEHTYIQIISSLPTQRYPYSIYVLEGNGDISRRYFNIISNEHMQRNIAHTYRDLSKGIVLSGNSAILLTQIQEQTRNLNAVVGYRNHSYSPRPNRQFALEQLLKRKEGIIEAKNLRFREILDNIDSDFTIEERANIAIASAYRDFLINNCYSLKL